MSSRNWFATVALTAAATVALASNVAGAKGNMTAGAGATTGHESGRYRVAIVASQFERIEVHAKHLDATATTTTDDQGVSTTTRPAYDVWLANTAGSADYGAMHVNHHGNAAFVFDTRHTAQPNLDGTTTAVGSIADFAGGTIEVRNASTGAVVLTATLPTPSSHGHAHGH